MLYFFGTLIASLIGAMFAPYFVYILNEGKIKREGRLKYLEEAYLLTSKIQSYSS